MMGHRDRLVNYWEWAAFTGWRKFEPWKPGQLRWIKRQHNKRLRREARARLRGMRT